MLAIFVAAGALPSKSVWAKHKACACLQEVKAGDRNRVRALFNRATHADLPPRKMKALFKRFLEYEQAHGDAASVAGVQKSAQQYVDAHFGA